VYPSSIAVELADELEPKDLQHLSLLILIVHSFHRRRLRHRNEYVHSAEVVPWQMFLATYVGMSIRKKNLSDTLTLCTRFF